MILFVNKVDLPSNNRNCIFLLLSPPFLPKFLQLLWPNRMISNHRLLLCSILALDGLKIQKKWIYTFLHRWVLGAASRLFASYNSQVDTGFSVQLMDFIFQWLDACLSSQRGHGQSKSRLSSVESRLGTCIWWATPWAIIVKVSAHVHRSKKLPVFVKQIDWKPPREPGKS